MRGLPLGRRTRDLLDVAFLHRCAQIGRSPLQVASNVAARSEAVESFYVDVSQSHTRRPWTCGLVRTTTTATRLYSFTEDRVLSEEELWGALGRHVDVKQVEAAGVTRSDLRQMLGNCMAVQPLATTLYSLIAAFAAPLLEGMRLEGTRAAGRV